MDVVGRQGEIRRGPAYEPRYRLPAEHVEALQRHRSPIEWREPPRIIVPQRLAAPTYQAIGTDVGGTGTLNPSWPTHATDDVAILIVTACKVFGDPSVSLSSAQGFTAVTGGSDLTNDGTNQTRVALFWHRATSGAMSAPTVADNHDNASAVIITFRGCITTGDPTDGTPGLGANASANTAVTVPGVTTTGADRAVLIAIGYNSGTATTGSYSNANLAGITERLDNTPSGTARLVAVTASAAAVGDFGNTTATISSNQTWAAVSLALKAAASSGVGGLLLMGVG